jgi:hypothetical protein
MSRRLFSDFSPKRSVFEPRSVPLGLVVNAVVLRQISLRVLVFLPVSTNTYSSSPSKVLFREGRMGEAWETPNKIDAFFSERMEHQ